MGKGNTWSNNLLALLFQAQPIANIAINATSSPLTNLYVSLHTANPGATGNQTTSEAAYPGYSRVPVSRTTGGWALVGETIDPVANVIFATATGGSETESYFGVGTAASGAGVLLYSGTLAPTINVTNGITPILTAASMITES